MALRPFDKPLAVWQVLTNRFDRTLETERGRFQAHVFAQTVDHGMVRHVWTNEGVIAQGVYRSNHPNARQLAAWKARGVMDIVSLRPAQGIVHGIEAERCAALGLRLHNTGLASREAPRPEALATLLDFYDTLPRPFLVHCKSGADRTGLAGALWAIHMEGAPVAQARRHLSLRHLHVKWSKTGVLDRVLDRFEAEGEGKGIALRDWITGIYDPQAL